MEYVTITLNKCFEIPENFEMEVTIGLRNYITHIIEAVV